MTHPALQCPDVDPMPQMFGREGVAEFVQKEMVAVRSLDAFVSVFGDALSTVQLGALGYALNDHVVFTIRIAF